MDWFPDCGEDADCDLLSCDSTDTASWLRRPQSNIHNLIIVTTAVVCGALLSDGSMVHMGHIGETPQLNCNLRPCSAW